MSSACRQGLNAAVSGSGLQQPVYKLPKQPEFLFQEEAAVHRRSWSENLTFYTGSGYLSGLAVYSLGASALANMKVLLLRCRRHTWSCSAVLRQAVLYAVMANYHSSPVAVLQEQYLAAAAVRLRLCACRHQTPP